MREIIFPHNTARKNWFTPNLLSAISVEKMQTEVK